MKRFVDLIRRINLLIGRIISFVLLGMLFSVMYEVVMRYVFNSPSNWSNEISQYLLVVVSMLGGAFCLAHDGHVRVDILYHRILAPKRKWIELLNGMLIIIICLAMVIKGGQLCYEALIENKRSNTILGFPLFPSMVMVPIGALLLAFQSVSNVLMLFMKQHQSNTETHLN